MFMPNGNLPNNVDGTTQYDHCLLIGNLLRCLRVCIQID